MILRKERDERLGADLHVLTLRHGKRFARVSILTSNQVPRQFAAMELRRARKELRDFVAREKASS